MKLNWHSLSRAGRDAAARHSARRGAVGQRGIALVVTLILLSVIAFMAIAFLVLSSSQRNAVTSTTDQNVARNAADAALAKAEMNLMASILVATNPFSIGLQGSTNYINPRGFTPGVSNPTNVNYDFLAGTLNTPLNRDQQLQNLTNLLYDPRPPVFITNVLTRSNDFRFYLDLNRNARFEPTGWLPVTNSLGQELVLSNNPVISHFEGDPQWVGGLEFPDQNHSANNPFTYRYAYIAIPASQTLDINYIHNYAKNPASGGANPMVPGGDHFFRNQGVGTWEMNLAGFLVDLNTNVWGTNTAPYNFRADTPIGYTQPNTGVAFDDALNVLQYRYGNRRNTLATVRGMFGFLGAQAFGLDYIDGYSAGPPMTNTWWLGSGIPDQDTLARANSAGWPGSFNANHYLSTQELFDPLKTRAFATHLQNAGIGRSSYDQYTFYRLLSQVGTDSPPEPSGKINLDYDNVVLTNAQGLPTATNFIPWDPGAFFTNAAVKLLANAGFAVGPSSASYTNIMVPDNVGNVHLQIQVWPTNYYSPSVHRMFQLAANIYDATTARPFAASCPTVFRPIFRQRPLGTNNVVFIVGYHEVSGAELASVRALQNYVEPDRDPTESTRIPAFGTGFLGDTAEPMVSGVPLVIGAKKGFPNFNEYAMQTAMYVSRLLEFRRDPGDTQGPIKETNQMFVVGITNAFGLEAWNSYSNAYPRSLQLIVSAKMTAIITNEFGNLLLSNRVVRGSVITTNNWRGWTSLGDVAGSFILPFGATNQFMFLTNSTYVPGPPGGFTPQTHIFPRNRGFYVPHWYLNLNTRVVCILVDNQTRDQVGPRIVDYVNLNYWEPTIDIMGKLSEGADCTGNPATLANLASQWCTNLQFGTRGPPMGVINQISLSLGLNGTALPNINSFSQDPYSGLDAESAVDGFRYNLMGWGPIFPQDQGKTFYKSNIFYVPFDPYEPLYLHTSWQANDPLVHYTIGDLTDLRTATTNKVDLASHNPPLDNMGQLNNRYDPWGGSPTGSSNPDMAPTETAAKDPLMTRSDAWDFPTNRFPNVGWLGRVHRGTPWQTIYLKSPNILLRKGFGQAQVLDSLATWQRWTGNPYLYVNNGQVSSTIYSNLSVYTDAVFSLPTNDWRILDLFTTAFNDNATRGQLSVNQTNLAAWSAVLSGVNVLPDARTSDFILPARVYDPASPPPLVQLVNGIINARTNFPNNSYQRLGDILAAPELTVNSPYILTNSAFVTDDVVERIPQQILGLLKGGEAPRFVIYSYGQALKPAVRSVVTSGPYLGLCTNYQVTAEVATRAVVRIDGAQPVPGQPYRPRAVVESFNVLPPD